MKKIMMAMLIVATFLTTTAFAKDTKVNPKVLKAFNEEFVAAQQVEWTAADNFYKATFMMNNQYVFAFYGKAGNFLGLTRYMSSVDLPLMLQTQIKKKYADFWITDLFEVANQEGTSYYMTVENAESVQVLKSSDGNDWTVYRKNKKS